MTSAHTLQQLFLTVNRLPSTNDHLNVISGFQTGHVVELLTNLSRFALQSIVIACSQTTARPGIKTILSASSVGVSESPNSDTIYKSSELSDNNSPKLDSRESCVTCRQLHLIRHVASQAITLKQRSPVFCASSLQGRLPRCSDHE